MTTKAAHFRLKCDRESLKTQLNKLIHITDKGVENLYSLVSLRANSEGVVLVAQDEFVLLELAAEGIAAESNGRISVPAILMHQITKALSAESMTIESLDEKPTIRISAGAFESEFQGLPDSPSPLERSSPSGGSTIEAKILAKAISQILFASSPSYSGRIHTEGVELRVSANPGIVRLVATDGRKLGVTQTGKGQQTSLRRNRPAIVPRSALFKLSGLLRRQEGEVTLGISDTVASCSSEGMRFTTRLLNSDYPDYDSILSQKWPSPVVLERMPLLEALNRVLLTYVQASDVRRVRIRLQKNKVELIVKKEQFGWSRDLVGLKASGGDFDFGFDGPALSEALDKINAAEVSLSFTAGGHCFLMPVGEEFPCYVFAGMV